MSRKALMQHEPDDLGLFSLATFQTMRLEALDLFDRSLAEGSARYLEKFLERQIAQEPVPLELLSQIAEDVHQRLVSLRQRHFEMRDQIRRNLLQQYHIDLSTILPNDPFEYHQVNLDEAVDFCLGANANLTEENQQALCKTLQEALESGERLYGETALADHLYNYISDWWMALHIVSVRGAWTTVESSDVSRVH
jgi:hypothetical protein